ncbi:hypothetical protein SEUCBS140593_010775 [Sporothrix eucalyptigena]|uniref:Uncharacterized protein n=1 Tax=Sporothrix eucalyptigena TaxID=1812306 RepID=A0ABP0D280_9PEZI
MALGRPRLSGILCLQCEFGLFNSPVRRQLSRLAAQTVLSQVQRRPQGWAQRSPTSINHLSRNSAAYIHGGRPLHAREKTFEGDIPLPEVDLANEALDEAEESISVADAEEIWNSLLGSEGEATETEVFTYINEMRPSDEPILPEADFHRVARNLVESFTVSQLQAYIRKFRKPIVQTTVYSWEVKRQPWVPEIVGEDVVDTKLKAIGPGSSLLLKGYIQTGMTNKQRIVVQLMRECWGVSTWEVMESPGQLDVTVREIEFALLTAGAQTWLRDISTTYSSVTTTTATTARSRSRSHSRSQTRLHRHIELVPGQNKLRVFAPASTASAILAEINTILQGATTKRLKLANMLRPEAVATATTSAVLRAVGTLTNSWVRLSTDEEEAAVAGDSNDPPELLVSWVASADRDPDLEDTGDMVFRMLLRAFGPVALPAPQATKTLDYVPRKKSDAQFLAEIDERARNAWSWEHRQGHWARLIDSLPQDSSTNRSRAKGLITTPSESSLPMELVTQPPAEDTTDVEDLKWYQISHTSTVATFGRVLHAQTQRPIAPLFSLEGSSAPGGATAIPDVLRILSPTPPPLLGMSVLPDGSTKVPIASDDAAATPLADPSTRILLRFIPDPKSPLAHRAPHLEVLLDAVPGSEPTLLGLLAITATNTSDVLYPTRPVDVRITQKRFFALSGEEMSAMIDAAKDAGRYEQSGFEPLSRFLEESQLQLNDGKQGVDILATPLRMGKLGLPSGVLLPAESDAGEEQQLPEVASIGYVFAGLEMRRRISTAFEGWTAMLTGVEAGRGDGRWTELSLEAIPAGNDEQFDASSKASFLQAVDHIVHGDRVQWLMPHEVGDSTKRI